MKNFWLKLDKPFFCLAPMADVTDCAFRKLITKYGKPDVLWTEFVAADGLAHPVAREKLLIDLKFEEGEHPIVAQIFGSKPENIREAAKLCRELGFDGIDINMGCPDRTIEKQGAGAATIKNPELAKEIIRAAKEGAGDLPVSVKTRIGYNPPKPKGFGRASKNDYLFDEEWIKTLLSEDIAALTVHLRTRKEMSDVPAHWELMPEIVALRDKINPKVVLIGNGDVLDLDDARMKCEESVCDGVMLGRSIFGNPWLFKNLRLARISKSTNNFLLKIFSARPSRPVQGFSQYMPSLQEKLTVMVEHTKLFESMLGGVKNFAIMKKHYKAYVNGFEGAKELRVELMEAKNSDEVEQIVNAFLAKSVKIGL